MMKPEHVQPTVSTEQPAYAPEGSAYHPDAPAGVEGDAYAEGGAEYEALERQRTAADPQDVPLPADEDDNA